MGKRAQSKGAGVVDEDVQLDAAVMSSTTTPGFLIRATPQPFLTRSQICRAIAKCYLWPNLTAEFFKMGASGERGPAMMKGAFGAEQVLYSFLPKHVPKPAAWGTYCSDPDTHFYLCEFVEVYDDLPSAYGWASVVSGLHLNSMGGSPTNRFGFHITTHLANVPVDNAWKSSWEALWGQQIKSLFEQERLPHKADEEIERLKNADLDRAIPRYLGSLESEGRSVKPCLIHSDLWLGNIKPMTSSDELCMFDACAYWGHNEGK
ncbi:hypothetical protein S40293_01286 [Stachybotrys chartarum IBT 40293]|nr:hypothetical protein S40293_01286 [Stachybotrys chartarum IBT 40293]